MTDDYELIINLPFKGKTKAQIKSIIKTLTVEDLWNMSKDTDTKVGFQVTRNVVTTVEQTTIEQDTLD